MLQNATANTLVQSTVPDHLRGRVMSVYLISIFGMMPLGSLQAGFVAERFSVPVAIGFGAIIVLLCGVLALWRAPQVRRLE